MATRTVSTKIVLDGEKEYRDSIKNINGDLKLYRSELDLVKAQYKGQEDSVEALTSMNDKYQKILDSQKEKVSQITERLEKLRKAQSENSDESEKYEGKIKALETSLNQAKTAVANTEYEIEQNNEAMQEGSASVADLAEKFGIKLPDGLKKSLSGVQAMSSGAVAALGAVTAAVTATVAIYKKLVDITTEAAAHADDVLTLSQITGIDIESIQELQYSSQLIDVSFDTIRGAMTRLKNNMQTAQDGANSAAKAFQQLGVSVTNEADGSLRNANDVFYELIDALGNVTNETERDALAMDILGKSAQDLNPLIKQGSETLRGYAEEAHNVGAIMTDEEAAALGAVDDAYQRLQLTQQAITQQMAIDMAPAIEDLYTAWTEFMKQAGQALIDSHIIDNLARILTTVLNLIAPTNQFKDETIPGLTESLTPLQKILGSVSLALAAVTDTINVLKNLNLRGLFSGDLGDALGFGYKNGNPNNYQITRMQQQGVWDQYAQYYHLNASGDMNYVGGTTWVGENGPELLRLPQGSRIYSAQESRDIAGDTYYITIDSKNVKEFNDIIKIVKNTKTAARRKA